MDDLYVPQKETFEEDSMLGQPSKSESTYMAIKHRADLAAQNAIYGKTGLLRIGVRVTPAYVNPGNLERLRYHHSEFVSIINDSNARFNENFQILEGVYCTLGRYKRNHTMRNVIDKCRNIAVAPMDSHNVIVHISVPTIDILDCENPTRIEYITIRSDTDTSNEILVTNENINRVVNETSMGNCVILGTSWCQFNFIEPKDVFDRFL